MKRIDRYRGAMLGLACGDALGTTLEFKPPGSFVPISDMIGGGVFHCQPGQWTDDTAMALCLAESLIEMQGFDARDQMNRYLRWYREGYLSSTGICFDIGNTVAAALQRFEQTGEPFSGSTDARSAGNGSLMRLAPLPLAFAADPSRAIGLAAEMSRTTHGATEAIDACRYYTGLIIGTLRGETRERLLEPRYAPAEVIWSENPLTPRIDEIACGSFKRKQPPEIRGTGYVVHSLEAALWAFWNSSSFQEGALLAVNLGDDADTTGAIYGQLAGAWYGVEGIPERWRGLLFERGSIERMADGLFGMSGL